MYLHILLLTTHTALVLGASCPPLPGEDKDHVQTYQFISANDYDRNVSSLSDVFAHPLGYTHTVWVYNDNAMPNPCVKVMGSANKAIELTVETQTNSRICVRGKTSSTNENTQSTTVCEQGRFQAVCSSSLATNGYPNVYYEFFCDETCYESDVAFWYRFAISEQVVSESEPWCSGRDPEFPSSLLGQFPFSHSLPNNDVTTASSSGAGGLASKVAMATIVITIFCIFLSFTDT